MLPTPDDRPDDDLADAPAALRDRRVPPRGVLPRRIQMWLMIAIAVVIVLIILLTGQREPTPRASATPRPAAPTLVPPERVRNYEQQLAAEASRLEQLAADEASQRAKAGPVGAAPSAPSADALADEQRRREYESLFADSIALSRRAAGAPSTSAPRPSPSPVGATVTPDLAWLEQMVARSTPGAVPGLAPSVTLAAPAPVSAVAPAPTPDVPAPSAAPPVTAADTQPDAAAPDLTVTPIGTTPTSRTGRWSRLLEGTVIETVLLNRLDGTFAGPVTCLVTVPVYTADRQQIVIPAGARVLGSATPVQSWGDSRLAVRFHRLVMPDGRTHSLNRFTGLGPAGETGLKDRVDRHYLQVFGASLAIGAVSGLAQLGTRSSVDGTSFGDASRQGMGASLAASAGRVLDRYLNVLPTITIREGHRIKVYLTNDLTLPVYAAVEGGAR